MQSTDEIVEEAKRKRTLSNLKPTSLPESHNTSNAVKPETHHYNNTLLPESHKEVNSVKQETHGSCKIPENRNTIKKVKVTVYITEEAWEDFNYIYGKRILEKRKTDKGDLMTEAIELLKQKENILAP